MYQNSYRGCKPGARDEGHDCGGRRAGQAFAPSGGDHTDRQAHRGGTWGGVGALWFVLVKEVSSFAIYKKYNRGHTADVGRIASCTINVYDEVDSRYLLRKRASRLRSTLCVCT